MRYLVLLCLGACIHGPLPTAQDAVAVGIVAEPMRRLRTGLHDVYFPEGLEGQARRMGHALKRCRPGISLGGRTGRFRLILIHPGYENAYMESGPTWPDTMVLPANLLRPGGRLSGLSPNLMSPIVCHEALHARQFAQRGGPWRLLQHLTGFKMNGQGSTESWFIEGLGTALEGGHGRPGSRLDGAYWRGAYFAHLALAKPHGTDALSPYYPSFLEFGGDYISGGHFVRWLHETKGHHALRAFVQDQGAAWLPVIGTGLRFRQHFGASADVLFRRFLTQWREQNPVRTRPFRQQVVQSHVGLWGRLSRSPRSGRLALYSKGLDQVARLQLLNADGDVLRTRSLGAFAMGGEPRAERAGDLDGFEFGRDGSLYLTVLQKDSSGLAENILFRLDGSTLATQARWSLGRGASGGAHPMGTAYVYVRYDGERAWLSQVDLKTGLRRDLWAFQDASPPLSPTFSPDGERIVFVRARATGGQQLWMYALGKKDAPRPVSEVFEILHNPRFISQQKVLMACGVKRILQACIHRLDREETLQVSEAPYGVLDPQHQEQRALVFLNRTGEGWSLDRVMERRVRKRFPSPPLTVAPDVAPAMQISAESEAISWHDGIMKPRFWLPVAAGSPEDPEVWRFGLWFGGSSDLLLHSYYVLSTLDADGRDPVLEVYYRSQHHAPWRHSLSLGYKDQSLQGNWGLERKFEPFLAVQGKATGLRTREGETFLAGPRGRIQFQIQERTGRGIVRRSIFADLQGAWFPPLGVTHPLVDTRLEFGLTVPSPLSFRQNLRVFVRSRQMAGAPASSLRLGSATTLEALSLALPERAWDLYRFQEAMKGYEDQSLAGRRLRMAGLDLNHRFPLHFGRLYPALLLPSLYFRHFDVSAFGRLGQLDHQFHRVLGVEASLGLASGGRTPWTIFARGGWRFDLEDSAHFQLGVRY